LTGDDVVLQNVFGLDLGCVAVGAGAFGEITAFLCGLAVLVDFAGRLDPVFEGVLGFQADQAARLPATKPGISMPRAPGL
jgi:hypothetical protein